MLFILGFWLATYGFTTLFRPYVGESSTSIAIGLRTGILTLGAYLLALHFNIA